MKQAYLIYFCFSLFVFGELSGQSNQKQIMEKDSSSKKYPIPPANENMLFYIQRTHNINTIIYEINYNKDSTINESEPVKMYWIRYADKGETISLSRVQKTFAYGISSSLIDKEKKSSFRLKLTAYDKKDIYLLKTKTDNRYHAYININRTLSMLKKIFLKTEGGTFGIPNVIFVELTGRSIADGKFVVEKFKP